MQEKSTKHINFLIQSDLQTKIGGSGGNRSHIPEKDIKKRKAEAFLFCVF